VFEHRNARLCCWSPDGQYLAVVSKCRIIVRLADTLAVAKLFTCSAEVQQLEWSGDSQFILCGLLKKNVVQVWSMVHSDWSCKITEGAGLASARWSFDSGHIFVISDFQVLTTSFNFFLSFSFFFFNFVSVSTRLRERKNSHLLTSASAFHLVAA
jgi:WD40 repeat protein